MIEKYLSPAEIAERLSISKRQAYNILYQVPHIERPLRASERAVKEWIEKHLIYPKA